MVKIDPKNFGLVMILSLTLVTILNSLLTNAINAPTLKTGPAFILLFASVFLIMLFTTVQDGRFDKSDMFMMGLVVISLIALTFVLKHYMPEIFSILPQGTKNIFSAVGI